MNDTTNAERERLAREAAARVLALVSAGITSHRPEEFYIDKVPPIILHAITTALDANNLAWGKRIGEKDNEIRSLTTALEQQKDEIGLRVRAKAMGLIAADMKDVNAALDNLLEQQGKEKQDSPDGGKADAVGSATVQGQATLRYAAQEALVALAVFKLTDGDKRYREICDEYRACLIRAHDLLVNALISSASTTPQATQQPLGKESVSPAHEAREGEKTFLEISWLFHVAHSPTNAAKQFREELLKKFVPISALSLARGALEKTKGKLAPFSTSGLSLLDINGRQAQSMMEAAQIVDAALSQLNTVKGK